MELDFKNIAKCKFTLSANEIRQYGECPRKRYYASRDCLAIRSAKVGKNLKLGSFFHATLAYYYLTVDRMLKDMNVTEPTKEQVTEIIDSIEPYDSWYLQDCTEKGIEVDALDDASQAVYECIVANYLPRIAEDLVEYEVEGCEVAFNMDNWPIDDVRYHGYIDMVVRGRSDQKVFFFEHKTCTSFRPDIYNRFDIQLHLYDIYGKQTYGDEWGGMLLNQVKKAKTSRGYDDDRIEFVYSDSERADFTNWLTKKTAGLVSPNNLHEPCNNYMSCKMCEYADICMKYGYEVPKTSEEIVKDSGLIDEEGNNLYVFDPRVDEEGSDE